MKAEDNKTSIAITGARDGVRYISQQVHSIIRKHEEELQRKKASVKETMKIPKKSEIELMKLMKLDENLCSIFPNVTLKLMPAEKCIQMEGPAGDISKLKLKILQHIAEFHKKCEDVSALLAEVMGSRSVMADLRQKVADYASAVIELHNDQIQVQASSREQVSQAVAIVRKTVCDDVVVVSKGAEEAVRTEAWKRFCDNHHAANNGKVKMRYVAEKSLIQLCCVTDMREQMRSNIKEFLAKNTFYTTEVEMDYGALRLLEAQKHELMELSASHPNAQVSHQYGTRKHPSAQVSHQYGRRKHPNAQVSHQYGTRKHPNAQVSHQYGRRKRVQQCSISV